MWKILVAVGLLASATAKDDPVHTCVLQRNTTIEQFKLSTLSDLFGEVLTTESDGNIYFVSICRPIPKIFYNIEKLSGAIKISSDGYTTDLGHINESNVIANENTIVLTYVGGDEDRNPRDPCKGLKWHTYLTFICDPSATKDVLTLIDEDPDQPVICQVWFEIKTSKTCVRHPNIPIEILEKEIIDQRKQVENKKSTEKHEINFNQIPSGYMSLYNRTSKFDNLTHFSNVENKEKNSHDVKYPNSINEKPSTNNEKEEYDSNKTISKDKSYESKNYYNFRTDKKPVKIEIEESHLNRNYSQNASSDYEPFVNEKPNYINEYKHISYEQNENILNRNDLHTINSLNKSTSNGKNNFDKENKSMNEKIKNDLNEPTSRDYLLNNKSVPASKNNKLHYDKNVNYVKENKSMYNKNDEHTAENKLFFDVKNESDVYKKHFDEENKLNHNHSHNLPSEYGYFKSENRYWGKEDKPTNDEEKIFNSKKNILKDELLDRENSKVIINEKVLTRNDIKENIFKRNISQNNNPQDRPSRNYIENYSRENSTVNNENKSDNNYPSPINSIRYYDNNNYENEPQESQDESFDMSIYNSKNNESIIDSNNATVSTITKKPLETNMLNKKFVDSYINKPGKENSGSSNNSDDGLINNNDKSEHNNGTFINQQNINNANKITTSDQSKSESHQSLINSNKNEKSLNNKVNKNVKPYKSQYYPVSSDTNRKSSGNSNNVNNNIEPEQSKSEKINRNSVNSNENENSDGKSNNVNQNIEPESSKSKESNQNPIDSDKNGNSRDNNNNVNHKIKPEQSKLKEVNQNSVDYNKNRNLVDNSNNVKQNMEPEQSKSKESNQNSVDSDKKGNLADNSNNVNQNMEPEQSKSEKINKNSDNSNENENLDGKGNNANQNMEPEQSKSKESNQNPIDSDKNGNSRDNNNNVDHKIKPEQSKLKEVNQNSVDYNKNRNLVDNSNNVKQNIEPEQSKSEKINHNSINSNENENSDGKSNNANQNIEPESSKSKESNQNTIDSDKNGNSRDNNNNVNHKIKPEQSKSKETYQNSVDSNKNRNLVDNSNNVNQNMEPEQSKSKKSNQNSVDSDKKGNLADNSNNVNQNMEPEQSKSKESNQNSVDSESKSKPASTTKKSIFGFDLEAWISKVFPNGFQFSPAIILGGLGSLTAIYAAIGTAINRYYYNLSGMDQIPFKGKFQSIYIYIKGFITKICCCGRVFDLESLDTTNEKTPLLHPKNIFSTTIEDETSHTREKRQTNSENDTQQGSDDDGNGGQNNKNMYGSISNDESSSFFGYKEKITNIEKNLLGKSINEGMGESIISKIIPTVKSIYNKLVKSTGKTNIEKIKENITKVTSSQFFDEESCINEGAKATNVERLFKDTEGKQLKVDVEQNKEIMTKNTTEVTKSSAVDTSKSQSNLISFLESQDNQNEANKTRDVEKKEGKYTSIILDKPQGVDVTPFPVVDILKEVIDSKVIIPIANDYVEKLIEKDTKNQSNNYKLMSEKHKSVNETKPNEVEQKIDVGKSNYVETVKTDFIDNTQNNLKNMISDLENISKKIKEDEKLNITGDTIESSTEDIKTKTNESKLKFLGLDVKKVDESKIRETDLIDDSYTSEENKVKNDDDLVEVIEEIIYVDDLGDGNEEEIIEETIETTTFESSPESTDEFIFDHAHKGHTNTVTIRKTSVRKTSSSSGPGEVKTTVETFVSEDLPECEKQKLGLHFGIGKSSVNVGLGEKKLKISTSGVKFEENKKQGSAEHEEIAIDFDKTGLKLNRNKKKPSSDTTEEIDGSREQKVIVPEKVAKKSKSKKMFKRSTSQLMEPEIQEIENESETTSSKKLSRSASSLLKFGKSRSKSSGILDVNKIPTTDVKVMSNFIDQERRSSESSQLSLTEYDESGERKSTNTLEGNLVTSVTGEIGASTSGLTSLAKGVKKTGFLADLGAASNSNENLNKRIKSKTKREMKEKSPPIWKF